MVPAPLRRLPLPDMGHLLLEGIRLSITDIGLFIPLETGGSDPLGENQSFIYALNVVLCEARSRSLTHPHEYNVSFSCWD